MRLKAENMAGGAKNENISVITPRFQYGWRRTGPVRNFFDEIGQVPVVGRLIDSTVGETVLNRQPLEVWRQKMERKNRSEGLTDIPFGMDNRTLAMTTALDTFFYQWDRHAWAKERRDMAEGLRKGLYDKHGDFSYDTWLRARSSLGPKVLSNVVQGALTEGKPIPHFTEVMDLFEHKQNSHGRRGEFLGDLAITLTSLVGPGAADYIMLKLLPATQSTAANPEIIGNVLGGAAVGATGGVLAGLAIDALPGRDLGKVPKALIPVVTGILGMIGANWYTQEFVIPQLQETIQVTHIPLNDYGWTIPVVATAGGMVFGYPRFKKHKETRDAIATQMSDLKGWRSMFAIMANSVDYMRNVMQYTQSHPSDPARVADINRHIYTKHPQLYTVVEKFNHRTPEDVAELQAVAGNTLKSLSEQVLFAEMVSFNQGFADKTTAGKDNPTLKNLIPRAADYFAGLTKDGLSLASANCDLLKTLADKKDYVAALSTISPTLAQVMITQGQEGNLGANDDTMHFGEAGMNTGTRGVFIHLVAETFNKLLTVPDSKRAELTNLLKGLGAAYTKSIPIGGLDRIYNPPAHLQLGSLYGYALLRSRPHTLSNPADVSSHGEYGSKGLMSDVGKAALGAMKDNPLITYLFLADVAVAIENADQLLVSVGPGTRRQIKNGLISLQREIATEIIRERFPRDKQTAVKFFTDGQYAFEAYTALTMLEEVCGNSVVQPIIAHQAAVLSPLFTNGAIPDPALISAERDTPSVVKFNGIVGDTPNLYTTQIIDFVWNAKRHPHSEVHKQLVEFLQRGMLPRLIREYYDRLMPSGRGEAFDDAQLENTVGFTGYALETVECDDLIPLTFELADVLESFARSAGSSLSPMGTMAQLSPDIVKQAQYAYRRGQALIAVSNRLLAKRRREIQIPIASSGAVKSTLDKRIERAVKTIDEKIAATVKTNIFMPPPVTP